MTEREAYRKLYGNLVEWVDFYSPDQNLKNTISKPLCELVTSKENA